MKIASNKLSDLYEFYKKELGSIYYHLEMYNNAIDSFRIALFLNKKYFKKNLKSQQEVKYNIGLCYFNLGDYDKARLLFMNCLRFERIGLLLNLIGLTLTQIKPALSFKYHLMALEEYKCEMSVDHLKEIEVINSIDNNSFRQVKDIYFSELKIKRIPDWLKKAYDL